MSAIAPHLTLGPVYYLWEQDKWCDFYFRIADEAPVSHVSIGETICSKRIHFTEKLVPKVAERLKAAGKTVIYSTLAMVTLERERKDIRKVIEAYDGLIEANDLSAMHLLEGRPHVIGPLVNVYNGATAAFLAKRKARAICLPPELPLSSVTTIAKEIPPETEIEVFAFGRLPLAISARCAHARSKGHIKDNCQFVCSEEPNGLPVRTLDRQNFLTLNGIQTMSHSCQALTPDIDNLMQAGIRRFRLSPQDCDMVLVARTFDDLVHGRLGADEATRKLKTACSDMPLSNGFLHMSNGADWIEHFAVK